MEKCYNICVQTIRKVSLQEIDMEIDVNKINPRIISARHFDYSRDIKSHILEPRVCYNYELEYYEESQGGVIVNEEYFELKSGDVNFRKPDQTVCGVPSYKGSVICFSLNGNIISDKDYTFGTRETKEENYKNELLDSIPSRISLPKRKEVKELFAEIIERYQQADALSILKANSAMYQLLALLIESTYSIDVIGYHQGVLFCKKYIEKHYTEEIRTSELVEMSKMSKAHFHRCFKSYVGKTPRNLITTLRMKNAQELLLNTDYSVGEIAQECGYIDSVYFTSIFHKFFGMSPSSYRKKRKQGKY